MFHSDNATTFLSNRFWVLLEKKYPEEIERRVVLRRYFWHRSIPALKLVTTLYVSPSKNKYGVFLGRNKKVGAIDVFKRLFPYEKRIKEILKIDPLIQSTSFPFETQWEIDCFLERNWPGMVDNLVSTAIFYEKSLTEVLKDS